jgi:hypothetical protein
MSPIRSVSSAIWKHFVIQCEKDEHHENFNNKL